MANAEAWSEGWQLGKERAQEHRAHKQELADEAHKAKIDNLIQKRTQLIANAANLTKGTPDYDEAFKALREVDTNLREAYDPQKHPGAIERFGHLLTDHLKITNPQDRIKKEAAKRAQGLATDEKTARLDVAAGPLSPEQQDAAASASQLRKMQGTLGNLHKLFPNAPPEVVTRWQNELAQQITGIKPIAEKYFSQLATTEEVLPDGTKKPHYWRVPMSPDEQPEEVDFNGQTVVPKTAQKPPKGLKYDQTTGEVINQDTNKRYSIKDIRKPDTPPEVVQMFQDAKAAMDDKQKKALELAMQRGQAFGAGRYAGFVDPNNPTQVIPMSYGEAARRGLHLATGAQYQTMEAMLKASTSGPIANEVVAFSTALQHADLLQQAAIDLNNNDTRALNVVANDMLTQFGDERPTNFNTIAGAYTREVTKALAAGHITDTEIAQNGLTIPRDASLGQILGAVRAYKSLMQSKINIRMQQIKAGMSGTPFLGIGGAQPQAGGKPQGAIGTVSHRGKNYWVDKQGNNLGVAP
jgi:hypothetical protein